MSEVTTAILYSTFKRPCLKAENEQVGCLNGGTCFIIPMQNDGEITGCSCTDKWEGSRCEFRFVDPEIWAHGASVASIATGITVGVFLVLAFIVGVAIYWWRYRRNRRLPTSDAEVSVGGNDQVLVPPGELKPGYDAFSTTDSRQNLTVDQETSTSLEAKVSRAE